MEFLLRSTYVDLEEVKIEDYVLEGDIIIEEDNEKKKKEKEKGKKKGKKEPLVLDISESIDWIKDSETKFNKPQFKNPKYKGPTHSSNWVTDNICMGGYPHTKLDIEKLINAGINTFVCLNGSDKVEFYKYEDDLPKKITYIHEPIKDMNVTTDQKLISLCKNIVRRIKIKKEKIFVHCAGGHGRTGTVVGCVLYLLYNLSLEQILNYLQFTHDQRDGNWFGNFYYTKHLNIKNPFRNSYTLGQVPVPQIEIQVEQMKRILLN
jgi:protein-tyrosine phosphatase